MYTFNKPNQQNLEYLPRVIVGPILRRLTTKYVSVFLVTRTNHEAELKLFDKSGNQVDKSGFIRPTQIGKNLWVIYLSINLENNNLALIQNELYYYDITFEDGPNLANTGILSGRIEEYVYEPLNPNLGRLMPSFIVPPTNINDLRIVHGSCRKLHGNFIDAIINVDKQIQIKTERPHLFLHTGDQIYADDVTGVNLALIRAIDEELITDLSNISAENDSAIITLANQSQATPISLISELNPDKRDKLIIEKANFTVDRSFSKNHLIRFGEFVGMYILAWSDIFWGNQFVPTQIQEVYPDKNIDPNTKEGRKNIKQFQQEIKQYTYGTEHQKKVKKVLANVSSLMILDDHEITDDVFITGKWVADTIGTNATAFNGSKLGKRIISNALTAYTLFQHIGNVDTDYSSFLSTYTPFNGTNIKSIDDDNILLPNVTTQSNGNVIILENSSTIDFHFKYQIEAADWEIIGINSRTNRQFVNDINQMSLLSDQSIDSQIKRGANADLKLSILMSPAPIWGFERVELIQLFTKMGKSAISGEDKGITFADDESWSINIPVREKFLHALFQRKYSGTLPNDCNHRVLVLCGDVHYGFAKKLSYVGDKVNATTYRHKLSLGLLCASSMKNEDMKTKFAARFNPDDEFSYFGLINSNGEPEPAFGGTLSNTYKYAVEQISRKYEDDLTSLLPANVSLNDSPNENNLNNNSIKYHHLMHGKNDAIIGYNNIGFVTFSSFGNNEPKIKQKTLWNRIEQNAPNQTPLTIIKTCSFNFEINMAYKNQSEINL